MLIQLYKIRENISYPQFGDNYYGKWGSLPFPVRQTIKDLVDELAEEDKIMHDFILLYPKIAEFHKTRSISLACEIADDLYKLYN